jgi:hypothetical protein
MGRQAMSRVIGMISALISIGLFAVVLIEPLLWPRSTSTFISLRLILGISGLLMMAWFIHHVIRTNAVPPEKRGLWVIILLVGNVFALPFFWFWYIRKAETAT